MKTAIPATTFLGYSAVPLKRDKITALFTREGGRILSYRPFGEKAADLLHNDPGNAHQVTFLSAPNVGRLCFGSDGNAENMDRWTLQSDLGPDTRSLQADGFARDRKWNISE